MCGISGYVDLKTEKLLRMQDRENVVAMLEMQKHRGPDDRGLRGFSYLKRSSIDITNGIKQGYTYKGIFGFNRLSIQDLSRNGHQPMCSDAKDVILVFNGEIYNADFYRKELKLKGYQFHGTSDTEVILNLYLDRGIEETLSCLNGMFALVIADVRKGLIFMARDRFGIKPMYYMVLDNKLYFSSEMKSFLAIREFVPHIDVEALNECMMFISAPQRTLIKEVEELNPGEMVCITNSGISHKKFFDINDYHVRPQNADFNEKKEELDCLLQKVVNRQMVGDVPVGCQLSGGVDSSLVSFYAEKNVVNRVKNSVSVIFEDECFSEETYIDKVAEKLNMRSHKYVFDVDVLIKNMRKSVWNLESIPTVTNVAALLLLSQKAKEHMTVLLSGEGADEVFGGYHHYSRIKFLEYVEAQTTKSSYRNIYRNWNLIKVPDTVLEYMALGTLYISPKNVAKVMCRDTDYSAIERRYRQLCMYEGSNIDKFIKYEMETYLPALLLRQDKTTMAYAVENRVPLLDNEVVDFAFSLPEDFLVGINRDFYINRSRSGIDLIEEKYILKELCADKFGKEFAYRNKCGFGVPLKYLMGHKKFQEIYKDIIRNMKERGQLNVSYVEGLYNKLPVLDWEELELLFRALCIELFMEEFIDKQQKSVFSA